MDSLVAKALRREFPDTVPAWRSVQDLRRDHSDLYQAAASAYAARLGLPSRVYLDNILWLDGREK